MNKLNNGNINAYAEDIRVLSEEYPEFFTSKLEQNAIPLNEDESLNRLVDWDSLSGHFSFFFDFDGCETKISDLLKNTLLIDKEVLMVEIGPDDPIIEVKTETFIDNWYDFFAASGFTGVTAMSNDGACIMEFTDRDFMLFSNFRIQ